MFTYKPASLNLRIRAVIATAAAYHVSLICAPIPIRFYIFCMDLLRWNFPEGLGHRVRDF